MAAAPRHTSIRTPIADSPTLRTHSRATSAYSRTPAAYGSATYGSKLKICRLYRRSNAVRTSRLHIFADGLRTPAVALATQCPGPGVQCVVHDQRYLQQFLVITKVCSEPKCD